MDILVVDVVGIVRTRLGRLLEGVPGVDAVGFAATPAEAVRLLSEREFRVVVVRTGLPGHPLPDVLRTLKPACKGARVIAYFSEADQVPWQTPAELGIDRILDLPRESRALASFVMSQVVVQIKWVQPNDRRRR